MLVLLQRLIIPMSTAPICALPPELVFTSRRRKAYKYARGRPLCSCSLGDVKLGITVCGSFRDVCAKKRGWSWWIVKFEITPFGFNGAELNTPLSSMWNLHETVVRDLARKWQWRCEIYRHRYWTDVEERRVQMGATFSKKTMLGTNRKNAS